MEILEKIWRRNACVVREDLSPILRYVISGIVAMLNVKRRVRGNGKRKNWQTTAITERTRQRHRSSGGRNKDYWKRYREKNPAYTERNRTAQKERNRRRSWGKIAKMDEFKEEPLVPSGRYRLVPLCNSGIAKMDELIVELGVISRGCGVEV